MDGTFACKSYDIPRPPAAVDVLFAFSAAHHFVAHDRTLAEAARVLRPGGVCVYYYDTASPRWCHRVIRWWMARGRPDVPEDVLVPADLRRAAAAAGLSCDVRYFPSLTKRAPLPTLYFGLLRLAPWLQRVLPTTVIVTFRKPA